MKTANDIVRGKIIDIKPNGRILIEAYYDDWYTLTKREYKECNVQMIDSRRLSDRQRNMCHKLIRCISDYSGETEEREKAWRKIDFCKERMIDLGAGLFSLADAPMSLVCEFQRYLIDFILAWEIPCNMPLLDYCDDTASYIYSCLRHKKCVICNRASDLHHIDRVGIGRDRHDIVHEGMEVLPLCREHHNRIHTEGDRAFMDKYHIERGIDLDKTLCKVYKLKRKKDEKDEQSNFNRASDA